MIKIAQLKTVLILFLIVLISLFLNLKPTLASEDKPKAKIMMLGLFHFSNPGKDVVKTKVIDVSTKENQAYLEALAQRIQRFKPTKVLLEYNPNNHQVIQQRFDDYKVGKYSLGINEIYQIGFRVAKLAKIDKVYSFDERNVEWLAQPLFDHMKSHDKATQKQFDQLIQDFQDQQNTDFADLSLKQLLVKYNQKALDDLNKYLYLMTNHVQQDGKYLGADASASWWHRNFRMYAKIQVQAQPGERVLVIGGQGHTAILKDLLALDKDREAVDVKDYL